MTTKKATQKSTKTKSPGFTEEEKAAAKERVRELKAEARGVDAEKAVLEKIAEMKGSDRTMAKRLHTIIKANAPSLSPKTWYGMPAYAKDGKVVCFVQSAEKFKSRYMTVGFSDTASLDDGAMWPTSFALTALTPAEEKKIAARANKAVRWVRPRWAPVPIARALAEVVSMTKTGVVIGVSGQNGRAVARRMLREGCAVRGLRNTDTALSDDLKDVEVAVGDRNDDVALAGVLSGGVDGVVDTVAFSSAHADGLLRFADAIGALTVISSVAVYADENGESIGNGSPRWPTAIRESQTLVPADNETYGGGKVKLEEALLQANRLPVSVLRPAAVCGPGSRHLREWWLIKRVLDDRTILPLKYRGLSKFHPSTTANIAALAAHGLDVGRSDVLSTSAPDCPAVPE